MFTENFALKQLVNKPVLGGKICYQMILFQEFDFEIIVKPGRLNSGPDHLSWIETGEEPTNIEDGLPQVQLFKVSMVDDQYEKIIQFLSTGKAPDDFTTSQKKQLVVCAVDFQLIVGLLYKMGPDEILRRYVLPHEQEMILAESHDGVAGGHYGGNTTSRKLLRTGLWW